MTALRCPRPVTGSTNRPWPEASATGRRLQWMHRLLTAHSMSKLEELAERVERLLVRHVELQRTNALLLQQVATLTQDRDALKARLTAARGRIDALLERLPAEASPADKGGEAA